MRRAAAAAAATAVKRVPPRRQCTLLEHEWQLLQGQWARQGEFFKRKSPDTRTASHARKMRGAASKERERANTEVVQWAQGPRGLRQMAAGRKDEA